MRFILNIFFTILIALFSLGNNFSAVNSETSQETINQSRSEKQTLTEKLSFQKHNLIAPTELIDLEIEDEDEDEEEKKVRSKINWEYNAALLQSTLALSDQADNVYSAPKNNVLIESSSLRTHLRFRVLTI